MTTSQHREGHQRAVRSVYFKLCDVVSQYWSYLGLQRYFTSFIFLDKVYFAAFTTCFLSFVRRSFISHVHDASLCSLIFRELDIYLLCPVRLISLMFRETDAFTTFPSDCILLLSRYVSRGVLLSLKRVAFLVKCVVQLIFLL